MSCNCMPTRRGFMVGCSAAIASLAGSRFNSLAFGAPGGVNEEILVVVFLRGGTDGLNLVVPTGGASNDRQYYDLARPGLKVPGGSTLPLGSLGSTDFGLHPSATRFHELFQDDKVSIALACGMAANERSHFDSMNWMELGTPGVSNTTNGWLTRHFETAANLPAEILVPSLAVGGFQPLSLLANYETINVSDPSSFSLQVGPWQYLDAQRVAMRNMYEANGHWLHQAGLQSLDAVDIMELYASDAYTPRPGANYPADSWFADNLKTVAQLVKLDLGLRVATVDLGGWDTHENQGDGTGGYYSQLVAELTDGLAALYYDLDGSPQHTKKLTVVVMSEFGRRVWENDAAGTDHGHGNNVFVMSGNAVGGLHGAWPGLAEEQLNDGDVEVTTDFRRVLSEILIRRLRNTRIYDVFPGYAGYSPLGLVKGMDFAPDTNLIFADDFETAGTGEWG